MKKTLQILAVCLLVASCSDSNSSKSSRLTVLGSGSSTSLLKLLGTGSPTSMKITYHAIGLSMNDDCSDPEVFTFPTPLEVEMIGNNSVFSGTPTPGTYKCVIMRMNDTIKFKVDSTAVTAFPAGCVSVNTEHTADIYREGEPDDNLWVNMDGSYTNATGSTAAPGTDIVETIANNGTPVAGAHPNQMINLTGSLTVPGTGVFYADFSGGIDGDGTGCYLEDGGFGFR